MAKSSGWDIPMKKLNLIRARVSSLFRSVEDTGPIHLNNGVLAEQLAEEFLCAKNWHLVGRNFNCKVGEIDRIFMDQETLVFVEVRLRKNPQVSALESIDLKKQRKLRHAAQFFLQKNPRYRTLPCRFDVIALEKLSSKSICWVADAF